MAAGIPIKMVVLTIVGMAGLAAMLVIIENGEKAMPEPMHADIISKNIIVFSDINVTDDFGVEVKVSASDGTPVRKASIVLSGLGTGSVNVTDSNGSAVVMFNKSDFQNKGGEGYLKMYVKANGFQDYSNDYAVRIVI